MEEAEALATNVAIMGTKMLAKGTLTSLQTEYGGAFSVRAVRADDVTREKLEMIVMDKFDGKVIGYTDSHGQISFRLPHDKKLLGTIMKSMESLKGKPVESEDEAGADVGSAAAVAANFAQKFIEDYTITGPTLEEVFMNVAREAGHSGVV